MPTIRRTAIVAASTCFPIVSIRASRSSRRSSGSRPAIALAGKTVDAETGEPIADAEVAPLKGGTSRLLGRLGRGGKDRPRRKIPHYDHRAQGVEARHDDYGLRKLEAGGDGFEPGTNRLGDAPTDEPNDAKARGKAAKLTGWPRGHHCPDAAGNHVARPRGRPGWQADCRGDRLAGNCRIRLRVRPAQGRFGMKITKLEWLDCEGKSVQVSADGYRSRDVPLADLSPDQELRSSCCQPTPIVRGQVFDEHGKPPEDCRVELQRECG